MGDLELSELLNRIGAAFWSVFTEEEKARTPEVDREIRDLFGKITARRDRIREISAGSQPVMFESTEVLQAMISAYWDEFLRISEEHGSFADKKFAKLCKAIKATDPNPDQDPDLLMHLFSSRPTVH